MIFAVLLIIEIIDHGAIAGYGKHQIPKIAQAVLSQRIQIVDRIDGVFNPAGEMTMPKQAYLFDELGGNRAFSHA